MCHCPIACNVPNSCRDSKCIKECKVDTSYSTYVTFMEGYTEITKTDLVNGCQPSGKFARYHPCNHGYQCLSGFCCPNIRVCLDDANTPMTKNDIITSKADSAAVLKNLFDAQASNTCQVTSVFGSTAGHIVPSANTAAYTADWSRCEESGGAPYAAGHAGNGVDGGFDKTLRDCACVQPYLLQFWDNRWVPECQANANYQSQCTYFGGGTSSGSQSGVSQSTTVAVGSATTFSPTTQAVQLSHASTTTTSP